jgi:hypothetical protein
MKVYGPYKRKDGRQHVILYKEGHRRTVSYPKFLMEQKLGRELDPSAETVHHKDEDFSNNDLSNLCILPKPDHSSLHVARVKKVEIVCVWCETKALKSARYIHGAAKQGKAGPFCGKSCSGKYGAAVQNGMRRFKAQPDYPVEDRVYQRV